MFVCSTCLDSRHFLIYMWTPGYFRSRSAPPAPQCSKTYFPSGFCITLACFFHKLTTLPKLSFLFKWALLAATTLSYITADNDIYRDLVYAAADT
jgi:hypothetical protein